MEKTIYIAIILILVVEFLLDTWLDLLNYKSSKKKIPGELADVYDADSYNKSRAYRAENIRFGLLQSSVMAIIVLFFYALGGFGWVDQLIAQLQLSDIWHSLLFFAALGLAGGILGLPFSYYSTFVIETKYGFNKTTLKTFVLDGIKSIFVSAIIGGGLLAAILWLYNILGQQFWLYAWALITTFSLLMAMFYSNIIVPLFNKQTPLPEGELRTAIENFAQKAGFELKNIYVIDGSKRSTRANAYFTGLGSKKRIVLYDTLINDLTVSEIVAVLAHEIGHYKKRHIVQSLILGTLQTGIMLYLFSLVIDSEAIAAALGSQPAFHIGLVGFSLLYSPVSTAIGLFFNHFSRKNEYQADAFAASFNLGDQLISGLKKLTGKNYGNLTPHPVFVKFNYSHPTLLQRIRNIRTLHTDTHNNH